MNRTYLSTNLERDGTRLIPRSVIFCGLLLYSICSECGVYNDTINAPDCVVCWDPVGKVGAPIGQIPIRAAVSTTRWNLLVQRLLCRGWNEHLPLNLPIQIDVPRDMDEFYLVSNDSKENS